MFKKTQPGEPGHGLPPKIIPTAVITKQIKQQYDSVFMEFKQNLIDVSEIFQEENIKELFKE